MSEPVYLFGFSSGLVDVSVYASDLQSAKRSALIACELMARRLNDDLDSEGSSLLVGTDIVREAV